MSTRSLARPLLLPLTPLYRLAVATRDLTLRRGWERVHRLQFPVISIGNLSTGGAGKTPFAITLAQALTARGFAVDVLSRGYGRQGNGAGRGRSRGHCGGLRGRTVIDRPRGGGARVRGA